MRTDETEKKGVGAAGRGKSYVKRWTIETFMSGNIIVVKDARHENMLSISKEVTSFVYICVHNQNIVTKRNMGTKRISSLVCEFLM